MPESFGARLRRRREEQGIALTAIAEQTKIKPSLLEALERDDVSHWPSGIFRRAFIRAYAQAIDLNPDVVVREFVEVHPEPADEALLLQAAAAAGAGDASNEGGPPSRLRTIVGSAIGSLARLRRPSAADPVAPERIAGNPPAPPTVELSPEPAVSPEHDPGEQIDPVAVQSASVRIAEARAAEPDLLTFAHLCTELGRVEDAGDVQTLLRQAAGILDATGIIVWVWDAIAAELRPALVHGYSEKVLAQLPPVSGDADNATAAAFRSARMCVIEGSSQDSGALAVPLLTSAGCAGVLAIELPHGREQTSSIRAAATILAAMLAQLTGGPRPAAAPPQADVNVAAVGRVAMAAAAADVRW